MPRGSEPLFASERRSSAHSEERAAAEDDALLGNGNGYTATSRSRRHKEPYTFWREVGLFVWATLATAGVIVLAVLSQHAGWGRSQPENGTVSGKRNLIFMVSDGMGPASLSMTRSFRQYTEGLEIDDILTLDKHLVGSSRTRSSNSLVTDSAAGATAFSCGLKSYNGAISMLPDHTPCGTVLEAAKRAGYMTGLVVTTDITDATPACFASHVDFRMEEDTIALHEIGEGPLGRVVDLMLGGGRCHFLPNTSSGGCRQDAIDVTEIGQKKHGWLYIDSRSGFDALDGGRKAQLPLLGLFASTDIPYELDRRNLNDVYPSLEEMASAAITILEEATRDSDKGFFLMIEGSRIDHAGHGNDPAAQVHEVLAYDRAFDKVRAFVDSSKTPSIVVATSDHETGGLSVARQLTGAYPQYLWLPSALAAVSNSSSYLAYRLATHVIESPSTPKELKKWINSTLIVPGLGINDASEDELSQLVTMPAVASYIFADMISRRAQIGWSSHGHSAVDVNVYAHGREAYINAVRGNQENIHVGQFLRQWLDVDVGSVTNDLRKWKEEQQKEGVSMTMEDEEREDELRKYFDERYGPYL